MKPVLTLTLALALCAAAAAAQEVRIGNATANDTQAAANDKFVEPAHGVAVPLIFTWASGAQHTLLRPKLSVTRAE